MNGFLILLLEDAPVCEVKNVLDIACNDGSQLDCFKSKGIQTYGIDPAENLYELSSKNHNIVCDYFSADNFDQY